MKILYVVERDKSSERQLMIEYYEKVRIYPNNSQKKKIQKYLDINRGIYNSIIYKQRSALSAYAATFQTGIFDEEMEFPSFSSEVSLLTSLRANSKRIASAPQMIEAMSIKRAFNAIKRRTRGQKLRFKNENSFKTITLNGANRSVKVYTDKIWFNTDLGTFRVRKGREIPDNFTLCSIHVKNNKYYLIFNCRRTAVKLPACGNNMGLDGGISNIITTSCGDFIKSPKNLNKVLHKIDNANRRLEMATVQHNKKVVNYDDKRRVEALRQLRVAHEKKQNILRDFFHKLSRSFVSTNDLIAVEKLSLRKMKEGDRKVVRSGLQEVALATFYKYLSDKAESAGRKYIEVNPAYTSQKCEACGYIDEKNRINERFKCIQCGYMAHSDHNAAKNILNQGLEEAFKKPNLIAEMGIL